MFQRLTEQRPLLARGLALVCVAALLGACSNSAVVTSGKETQSETASTIGVSGGNTNIVVSYNDETNESAFITYPDATDRLVVKGASLMGWSWSNNGGAS